MKRLVLILAALAALALPARGVAQTIPVRLGGELSSLVGLPFDLPIVVDLSSRSERLGAYALRLAWNPAVLQFVSDGAGSFGDATANGDSLPQGVMHFAAANPAGVSGVITLLVGRFEPLRAETTTVRLQVTELFAAGTFADLLPSAVVSDGSYCPARGRYGDIDRDANVNSRDALIALSNAVGLDVSAFDISLGDVDASGTTNARDALVILSSAVGLNVAGFRVNTIAGGACSTGNAVTLVITPGTVGDVLPGTTVRFAAQAREASGALQAVPAVSWRSSNANIVAVLGTGDAVTRDTGTATITAVRDGRDSASVAVHVVARRRTTYISAAAFSAVNQLGSEALPYATIGQTRERMSSGDTIVVLPGRYPERVRYGNPVVIVGKTVGGAAAVMVDDGTDGSYEPAITFEGAGQNEVHDLTIDGFLTGVMASNGASVLVDSLRLRARPAPACANYGIFAMNAPSVVVRRSQLVGDGQWDGCATGIEVDVGGALLVEDVVIGDFGYDGIAAFGVDSVIVRRSTLHDNYHNGVRAEPAYFVTGTPGTTHAPAQGATISALVVEDSRLLRNYYEAVDASEVPFVRVANSVIEMLDYDDAIYVEGTADGHGRVELVGDSIHVDDTDWLDAYGLDSVSIDGVRVQGGYDGYFYDVGRVRATNSTFHIQYGTAFDVNTGYYAGPIVRPVVALDSVEITGTPDCGQCADGVYVESGVTTINRLRADNLDDGVSTGDSNTTVTNSVFTNVYYGIYAWANMPGSVLRVSNVTMTDVPYGIESENLTSVIEGSTLTRGYTGIETWDGGVDTVRTSTVSDYEYAVELYDTSGVVADNTILRPYSNGIYVEGPYTRTSSGQFAVLRNSITCNAAGADYADALDAYKAHLVITDNTISGCNSGIWVSSYDTVRTAVVRGNIVAIAPQADYPGIAVRQRYRAEVVGNTVTGGAPYGDGSIRVGDDYSYRMPRARVDSNVVTTPLVYGIVAYEVDTLQMFGNRIEDFTSGTTSYVAKGAIGLYGNLRGPTLIQGNTIRRSHGMGIAIDQVDTATVVVDSNAISGSDSAAVRVVNGHVWLKRNNIRNNLGYGAYFATAYDGYAHRVEGNAFQGNGLYAVYVDPSGYDSVDASGNWWGVDEAMPGTAGADSVFGSVGDASPLATEPEARPPLAPPAWLAARPILVVTTAAAEAGGEALVVWSGPPAAQRPAHPERPAKPEAQRRRPAGASAPTAASVAAVAASRTQAEAAGAARMTGEQARAQREAARAAHDSAQAAERERRRSERRSAP